MWPKARKTGAALFAGGLLGIGLTAAMIRSYRLFYPSVHVGANSAVLIGIVLMVTGDRTPPVPNWLRQTIFAAFVVGALIAYFVSVILHG
jgi:hypothetical protein